MTFLHIYVQVISDLLCSCMQVQRYIDPWPEAQWGKRDLSSICVMASSRSQVTS